MMGKKKRQRLTVGDVVAIPLPDGQFAYARVYRDASIGVYNLVTRGVSDVSEIVSRQIAFWTGCFSTAITSGDWPIIGQHAFHDTAEAWPPPNYIQDVLNPDKLEIYHRGERRPATKAEVRELEKAKILKPEEVVMRIMDELRGCV